MARQEVEAVVQQLLDNGYAGGISGVGPMPILTAKRNRIVKRLFSGPSHRVTVVVRAVSQAGRTLLTNEAEIVGKTGAPVGAAIYLIVGKRRAELVARVGQIPASFSILKLGAVIVGGCPRSAGTLAALVSHGRHLV